MRKLFSTLILVSIIVISCNRSDTTSQIPDGKYIEWRGGNETADAMVLKAMFYYMNIEREMAYTYYKGSLEFDSTLFGSHVMLAWMSPAGEIRKMHQDKARELVKDNNENSKLLVSFFDIDLPAGEERRAKRHEIWSKMYEIEPDGRFIHFYYALTKPTPEERISELEVLLEKQKNDKHFLGYGHIINRLGYLNYGLGNTAKAKNYFDEYIAVYSDGYNPYDSMGDYHFWEKDYDKSLSFYKKSLERYPGNVTSINKVKEISELKASLDRSVLDDPARSSEEKEQDSHRKAVDVYTFLGIEAGMTVADLWPGGGYNTHLLSRLMGDDGKVYCMMGFYGSGRYDTLDKIEERIKQANLSNVQIFSKPSDLPVGSIDVMVSIRNYHDAKTPRDQLLAELHAALKPNGILGIVDVATDRPGWDDETHRLNEQVVINECTSNGFELVESSDMLRNPDDDHSIRGFDEGRHTMDRYLLKFRKVAK